MKSLSFAVLASVTLCASAAHADLVMPGERSVDFSFKVTGLPASGDPVLLAYPCGSSNGVPTTNVRKLEEGKSVSVGRRGGSCDLYAVSKDKYAAFAAKYKPTDSFEDKPLADFIAKTTKCKGGPSLQFFVMDPDTRKSIEDVVTVKTLTATSCEVTSSKATETATAKAAPPASATAAPSAAPSAATSATAAAGSSTPAPSAAPAAAEPKKGCSVSPGHSTGLGGLMFAGLALAAGLRRRSRQSVFK